jgi:phosphoglycolate phosphatase/putative hydrolase of the HAD superfamily
MRTWSLPEAPCALLFDLDSTLYTNAAYARFQNRILVERLALERGETLAETEATLARLRDGRRRLAGSASCAGGEGSLGSLFLELGIPTATSVRWREELIRPADWIVADPLLDLALASLARRFRLALVTNNPHSLGEASLRALGVASRFELVIGLDDSGHSKPDPASFALAASRLALPPRRCISVGDREDVDLVPALGLGMGGILIAGVEEVYALPVFFDLHP